MNPMEMMARQYLKANPNLMNVPMIKNAVQMAEKGDINGARGVANNFGNQNKQNPQAICNNIMRGFNSMFRGMR